MTYSIRPVLANEFPVNQALPAILRPACRVAWEAELVGSGGTAKAEQAGYIQMCVSGFIVRWKQKNAAPNAAFQGVRAFRCTPFPVNIKLIRPDLRETLKRF